MAWSGSGSADSMENTRTWSYEREKKELMKTCLRLQALAGNYSSDRRLAKTRPFSGLMGGWGSVLLPPTGLKSSVRPSSRPKLTGFSCNMPVGMIDYPALYRQPSLHSVCSLQVWGQKITDLRHCKPQTLCNIDNLRSMHVLRRKTSSKDLYKPHTMTQMAQTNGSPRVLSNLSSSSKLGESGFEKYIYSCRFVRD